MNRNRIPFRQCCGVRVLLLARERSLDSTYIPTNLHVPSMLLPTEVSSSIFRGYSLLTPDPGKYYIRGN
jgi:hypothetical protein